MGILRTMAVSVVALLAAGCSKNEIASPGEPAVSKNVNIVMTLPGAAVPNKKSMEGDPENDVKTIDVLVFVVNDDNTVAFDYYRPGKDPAVYQDGSAYKVKFAVELKADVKRNIVVIANARHVLAPLFTGSTPLFGPGEPKVNILKQLVVNNLAGAWPSANPGYTPIPMYGEIAKTTITSGTTFHMELYRMLARVDVVVSDGVQQAGDFTLTGVCPANPFGSGYIAPKWNELDGSGSPLALPVTQPNVRDDWHPQAVLGYAAGTTAAGNIGNIYLFESPKISGTSFEENMASTYMIVRGTYKGKTNYYRVDFTYDGTNGGTQGAFMPLLRNHRYILTIDEVSAQGYETQYEAIVSYGVKSNMRVRTISYDQSVLRDINFNGQYMLGVENAGMTFDWIGRPQTNLVVTDFAVNPSQADFTNNGWRIVEITDAPAPGAGVAVKWLSVTKPVAGNLLKGNLTIEPEVNLDPETVHPARTAYIHLKAGRLTHTIKVTQEPAPGNVSGYVVNHLSNSYIVKPGSDMMLIPVAQANNANMVNEINHGALQVGAGEKFTGNLLWTDYSGGLSPDGPVEFVKAAGSDYYGNGIGDNGYLLVIPGCVAGNAVGEIKVKGGSRWAWHIWTTDYNPNITGEYKVNQNNGVRFMDRHLGSLVNTPTAVNADYTNCGLLYWHSYHVPAALKMYNATGEVFSTTKIPHYYGTNYESDSGWWSGNQNAKTGFDPCPKGWAVPSAGAFSGLTNANRGTFNKGYTWDGSMAGQPAIGYFPNLGMGTYGSSGAFWTVEHDSDICCAGFFFNAGTLYWNSIMGYDGDIAPVRCIQLPPM